MDHDDDGETSYNTFVDDVAFEPTYLQALLTAAGRNVATKPLTLKTGWGSAAQSVSQPPTQLAQFDIPEPQLRVDTYRG